MPLESMNNGGSQLAVEGGESASVGTGGADALARLGVLEAGGFVCKGVVGGVAAALSSVRRGGAAATDAGSAFALGLGSREGTGIDSAGRLAEACALGNCRAAPIRSREGDGAEAFLELKMGVGAETEWVSTVDRGGLSTPRTMAITTTATTTPTTPAGTR
jgi:hypothetical protein